MLVSGEGAVWQRSFAVLTAVAVGLLAAAPSATAIDCNNEVVRDYAKVLERLPAVRAVPFENGLNFAPGRVSLSPGGRGSLQLGSGERGFNLSYTPYYAESSAPTRRLDWLVTSRLVEVDRRGRRLGEPQKIEKQVKRLWPSYRGLDFAFQVPGKPALYRLEIVFENRHGKRLGRFGENFRVLRPSLDVDFSLNGTSFRRGEMVRAQLINRGAAILSFGLGQTIEYFDGTTWVGPPPGFGQHPVPAILLFLGPGESGSCWQATIPADAPPGLYRFSREIDYVKSSDPREWRRRSMTVSSEFTVLPE
jgi:hypothetical protein